MESFLTFQLATTITWLWRWLSHRLSKPQSPTTVLLRTPTTQMIIFNQDFVFRPFVFEFGQRVNHVVSYESCYTSHQMRWQVFFSFHRENGLLEDEYVLRLADYRDNSASLQNTPANSAHNHGQTMSNVCRGYRSYEPQRRERKTRKIHSISCNLN